MRIRRNSLIEGALLFLLALAFAHGSAASQVKPDNAAQLAGFEKSIDAGKASEIEGGLFNYVVANPKDARGFYLLAKLRLTQGRLTEAKSLLGKSLALDPKLVPARLTLARVSFQMGDADAARTLIAGIADTELTDVPTRLRAAETASTIGDCPRAIVLADKLPPPVRNNDALPLRAECYLQTGDTKNFSALPPLAKTIAKKNPATSIAFAAVMYKAAMHRETVDLMRLVIAAAPQNFDALLLLAKSEIALKDFAAAKTHLARAEKLQPRSAALIFVNAQLESEQGNNAKSFELLEKSLVENPDDVEVLARFVVVALRVSQNGKAMRAAGKLLSMQPGNLDYLYLNGVAALQNNNLVVAESSLIKFTEARPKDSLGCLALGLTLAAQSERIAEARGQLDKCLVSNPGNYEAAYQLGLSYKVQGETVKAVEYLEQTVRISPNYAAALRDLGAVYLQSGNEAKARPVLEKSATLAPNDAEVHFQLSRLYNLVGEPELARKHLEIFQKLKEPKKDGM